MTSKPYLTHGKNSSTITVSREGDFSRSGPEEADETEVFQGEENTLTMNQTYSKDFQCLYMLHRYPFDTQVLSSVVHQDYISRSQECRIDMTVSALDQKTVQLMANQMIMKSKTTLTQYEMTKWTLEKTERGISMIIVFKRMVTSELLTTYMPSLLLIFTTYATTFFKPFYFEVSFGSLLYIRSLFSSF